jgi:putative DNA primase/helicase
VAWMIEDCLAWQKRGPDPPKAVTDATEAYLEAEDAMGARIEERCEKDPKAWTKTTELFESWSSWAEGTGEWVGSNRQFGQKLEDRGLRFQKRHGERGYWGLRLRESRQEATLSFADQSLPDFFEQSRLALFLCSFTRRLRL